MRKLLLILLLNAFAIMLSMAQIVNKFRDSSQFTKGVRFDSTLHFAGLKTGVAADSIILVADVNGTVKKINKSSLLIAGQIALDDSIAALRAIRKVDSIYRNSDSIVYKINGIRYSIKDSTANLSGYALQTSLNDSVSALRLVRKVDTLYRNLDSIIFTINGVRRAIKDTLNQIPTLTFTKNSTKDSIITTYNGIRYAVKDSVGSTSGFVPYNGATQDVDLGAFALNAFAVKINGTNGNGHINLRHQASNATAQGQSSTIFADNNGDLKWKNDGLSYATLKMSGVTADRIYRFPDSTGTVALLSNIPTLTFAKNTGRDSIILTYNGTRSAVKDSTGGGGGSLSSLTAATASNTINNVNNTQEWQWNSLSGTGLKLSNNFTGSQSGSILMDISNTGTIPASNTTTGLRVTNTKVSVPGGTTTGIRVDVNGSTAAAFGVQISHAGSSGSALDIVAGAGSSNGIQMNSNRINFRSNTEYIQSDGSVFYHNAGSLRNFIISSNNTVASFTNSTGGAQIFTIGRPSSSSHTLIFGGDMSGSSYRSELTSNNTILGSGGSLKFSGNTGLAGSYGTFTPTYLMTVYGTNSNVGIGTETPVTTALLEMSSTTKGFLLPRMTTTQRDNIVSPATGLMIYDTTTNKVSVYNGTAWKYLLYE